MWLPQGGALKIENLQFTQLQYYNATLFNVKSYTHCLQLNNHKLTLGANDKVLDRDYHSQSISKNEISSKKSCL